MWKEGWEGEGSQSRERMENSEVPTGPWSSPLPRDAWTPEDPTERGGVLVLAPQEVSIFPIPQFSRQ